MHIIMELSSHDFNTEEYHMQCPLLIVHSCWLHGAVIINFQQGSTALNSKAVFIGSPYVTTH